MTIDRLEELKQELNDLALSNSYTDEFDSYDFYDYMPQTFDDLNRLIDAEIERLSVTDEEISQVLSLFEDDETFLEIEYGEVVIMDKGRKIIIEALKAYRPVRKNRTTEPVEKTDELPCDWCENPRMIDGWISIEGRGASMYIDEFRYCPNCGRKL